MVCSSFIFLCVLFLCVCVPQVAEMHGELIEFNERLYRSLMAKDHLIVQMRQELIDLRGPVSVGHTHTHARRVSTPGLYVQVEVSRYNLMEIPKFRRKKPPHLICKIISTLASGGF